MVIFKNLFNESSQSEIMTTALDLARAAASFASNPAEIASPIHDINEIAAQSGSLLSAEDEAILFELYLKIERYLTTSDPVRTFDKTELRSKASRGLRARLEGYEKRHIPQERPNLTAV